MKTAVVSLNSHGDTIAGLLKKSLDIDIYSKGSSENFDITFLSGRLMKEYKAIIFISSTGIAVRAIAAHIVGKHCDPAVLVVDCLGKYVISLLSGHLGGANDLTREVADIIGAEPVITTATDNLGLIAPDSFAQERGLTIDSLKDAKEIAALLVAGEKVAFMDEEQSIEAPKGYSHDLVDAVGVVYVTNKRRLSTDTPEAIKTLKLIRKDVILGIGCRKNYSPEKMRSVVLERLEEYDIDSRAVKTITSVEVKKDEKAIIELARSLNAEFKVFKAEEIKEIQHKYEGSDFVEKSIGVRAVCEPCVELCHGRLITDKISCQGMTLCIGKEKY